jgi:predicted ferric reductase
LTVRPAASNRTDDVMAASSPPVSRNLPRPRLWSIRAVDVYAALALNGVLMTAMWIRHGGIGELGSMAGILTAIGQLTALYGTYGALIGLVLMSRSPWLDHTFGTDRLAWAHRWVGFATVWLLLAHGVFTTVGWAFTDERSILGEAWALLTTYPFVLMTVVGFGMFVAVAVTSVRIARRSISYETWHFIHFYAYLAIALTFAHQLVLGADFASDPMARIYWSALYVAAIASIVVFRFGQPIRLSLRHRMRVANVVTEAPGIVSIYVTGRDLDRLPVRAGQYFMWRFLARDGWWRAHPYSLSAAPNGKYLRLTVKDLGDDSRQIQRLPIGTMVAVEGPYGALTDVRRSRRRVLLVAGGIGITPLRALLEDLPAAPGDLALIYRARSWDEVVFRDELDTLAALRGATVTYLVGRRGREVPSDPLGSGWLRHLVPDVADRDVYICGSDRMMDVVGRSLRALHVPEAQIHIERFAF